jgi:hypothetical protein
VRADAALEAVVDGADLELGALECPEVALDLFELLVGVTSRRSRATPSRALSKHVPDACAGKYEILAPPAAIVAQVPGALRHPFTSADDPSLAQTDGIARLRAFRA